MSGRTGQRQRQRAGRCDALKLEPESELEFRIWNLAMDGSERAG